MADQPGFFALEAGPGEGDLAALQRQQVVLQQQQIGRGHRLRAVAADAASQLDQRATGGWFDDGPVVIVIASHLGNRRGQHHEQLVLFGIGRQCIAHQRMRKQRFRVVATQQAVQFALQCRAQQQRMT